MGKLATIVVMSFMAISLQAQDKNKKTSFEVKGNCGMCEDRIEKAALGVQGVKYAAWDVSEKELTLILNEKKCSEDQVKKAIAEVGHDTDKFKATDSAYNKLPACCKYRDAESTHMDHH
jgi:copper chaperone CopZ